MEIVIIQRKTFNELIKRFEVLNSKIKLLQEMHSLKTMNGWLDSQQVCTILNINSRTLQTYRNNGKIGFSQINHKIFYKQSEIQRLLEDNYQKSKKHHDSYRRK